MNEEQTLVNCRRCGCTQWKYFTTTSRTLDTETKKYKDDYFLKTEFRCAGCDTKALVEQTPQLESMSGEAEMYLISEDIQGEVGGT